MGLYEDWIARNPDYNRKSAANVEFVLKMLEQQSFDALSSSLLNKLYPVGSIKMSVENRNPALDIGGTWTVWGSGRVPVGVNTTDTDFNTVEKTGGSKTNTLTTAQIPAHSHTQNSHNHTQNSHNHTQNAHRHRTGNIGRNNTSNEHDALMHEGSEAKKVLFDGRHVSTGGNIYRDENAVAGLTNNITPTNQVATAVNLAATATNNNTGGGEAHNNLQPFITCYFFKRTA